MYTLSEFSIGSRRGLNPRPLDLSPAVPTELALLYEYALLTRYRVRAKTKIFQGQLKAVFKKAASAELRSQETLLKYSRGSKSKSELGILNALQNPNIFLVRFRMVWFWNGRS